MRLHQRLVVALTPTVLVGVGLVALLGSVRSEQVWKQAMEQQLRLRLTEFKRNEVQERYELLVDTGFADIQSFENAYRDEALQATGRLGTDYNEHIMVFAHDENAWHCRKIYDSEVLSQQWSWAVDPQKSTTSELAFNESAQEYYVTERFEPWNWTIVAAVSNDWLLGHLTQLRREALVVALVVWFVTGASVLFIVKHFVLVPLVRMERETEQITGVSDSALPVDEADEFTRLERVIHEVGKTVGFQRRALEDVNSQLEQRVFQQTSELTKKNAALKEEVSQRNLIEQELLKLLDEKETLVREVHHRVKNNLALLYSLIQLQSSTRSSPELERELSLIQARIETMALIHGQLYRSDDLESVEAADYLNKLIDYLEKALSTTRANVRISRDLSPASLDHATARTCGLIVNELVTNSIIHGFPDDRRGEVRVALNRLEDGSIRLCVADNGVGIPDDLVQGTEGSLGMTLVHSLSQQLRGTASVTSENGTTVVVEFPGGSAA